MDDKEHKDFVAIFMLIIICFTLLGIVGLVCNLIAALNGTTLW